ncbi:MAG: hypothetical protein ACE5GM_11530 [bacterium]
MKNFPVWVLMLSLGVGCSSSIHSAKEATGEKKIWSSEEKMPAWTMEEPDSDGAYMYFVSVSERTATDAKSREIALEKAIDSVTKYMGTQAKLYSKRVSVDFGLESKSIDSTLSSVRFKEQLAEQIASNVKAKKWYQEKWETPTGIGWKSFVLAKVPLSALDNAVKEVAKENKVKAQQKAKEVSDDVAKAQTQKAVDFWDKIEKSSMFKK